MTLTAGQGIARITWALTGRAKLLGSGFSFTASSSADPNALAANIAASLVTGTAGAGPATAASTLDAYEWIGVDVSFETGSGRFDGSHTTSVIGTNHNTPMPTNCCILLRKHSGLGNRHGRGRMYLPPYFPGEQLVDGVGVIDNASRSGMETAWGNWLTNMASHTDPVTMCVGSGFTPVTSVTIETTIATQRKRLR